MARFVGRRDMVRVLEADKPWIFRDDLVLVADGACHTRWTKPLLLTTMWVQLHNEYPMRGFRDHNEYPMLELSGYRGRPDI